MAKMNPIWLIVGVIVIYMVSTGSLNFGAQSATSAQSGGALPYISTGATVMYVECQDALSAGTQITPCPVSARTKAVGQANYGVFSTLTSGTTTKSPGDVVEMLVSNSTSYFAVAIAPTEVPKAPTMTTPVSMYAFTAPTVSIFNTDGTKTTTAGTVNQTVATGGAYNMKIRIDGTDKKSTGDMVCVLEASNSAKMNKMALSFSGITVTDLGKSKPSIYSLAGTTSDLWVAGVSPVIGAQSPEGTLYIESKTAQSLSGTYAKVVCMAKQKFVDTNTGLISYGIEDSLGNSKNVTVSSNTVYFSS